MRDRVCKISAVATSLATLKSAEEIKATIDAAVIKALADLSMNVDGVTDFDVLRKGAVSPNSRLPPVTAQRGRASHRWSQSTSPLPLRRSSPCKRGRYPDSRSHLDAASLSYTIEIGGEHNLRFLRNLCMAIVKKG